MIKRTEHERREGFASERGGLPLDPKQDPWLDHLQSETRSGSQSRVDPNILSVPTLTLLWHPSVDRIGEHAFLPQLDQGHQVEISRLQPLWEPMTAGEARPLADPRVSRRPVSIIPRDQGYLVDAAAVRTAVRVDGESAVDVVRLPADCLQHGVVIALADRILMLLHRRKPQRTVADDLGLVGDSAVMQHVRREIRSVAPLDVTVLISGESGTGKELVARAIQRKSRRCQAPFLALNMAAVTPSLASAELFGASKGAFSGASQNRDGYFRKAGGGTLFLDEIGEAPMEIQTMLLRTLETGDIQPVGAECPVQVDVRLLAATDADLEGGVRAGRLSAPLLHRLAGFVIELPPLRHRREDISALILHFLREELGALGELDRIQDYGPYGKQWFPCPLVERLVLFHWPGNVRQLHNVVRQLVVADRCAEVVEVGPRLERLLQARSSTSAETHGRGDRSMTAQSKERARSVERRAPAREYRDPSTIEESELVEALRCNRWQPKPAAEALGVSRASLYGLIDRSTQIQKASELGAREIEIALQEQQGDLGKAAEALRVSKQGLKLRVRELNRRG